MWLAGAAIAFAVLRMARGLYRNPLWRAARTTRQTFAQTARKSWSPHVATCVIGVTFVVILLASGNWAYTDVLAELAHGMASNVAARVGLFVALVAGAVFGGASTNYTLACDPGAFTVSGTAGSLEVGRVLSADAGSYAISGTAASLLVGREVAADAGSFTISGTDATLTAARRLSCESGTFTVTGTDASLKVGRKLS